MAKPPAKPTLTQDEDTPRKRRGVGILGSILLGLIALSMLGFGVSSFGGGTARIGSVGDQNITANDYASALQSEVNRYSQMVGTQVPLRDLIAAGLDKQVLGDLVRRAALDGEMDAAGLSVGDAKLAAELVKIPAFTGLDGQFDRAAYGDALRRSNLTEVEFEANLRADIARGLLQNAVTGAAVAPAALTDAVLAYSGETRSFTWLSLAEGDLPAPLPAATDADVQGEYDSNIAAYTRPEAKRIDYVALLPDDLAKDMPVDEAAVAQLYQDRIDQFVIPEKRLVERLVYPNAEAAAAAKAQLDAGTPFEDLVAARNLTLNDIDLGDVARSDLGAAGEAVFALAAPGVVGPLDSDLGPALYRMNAILPAQETTLDQARPDLASEVQLIAARKAIADRVDGIDDALAGGATLADLAASEGLALASLDYAKGADDNAPIAAYAAFAKAADALAIGDFPEAIILEDGGVVAISLRETVPPTPRPLADVKEKVSEAWRAKALASALEKLAGDHLAALQGGADFASLGAATASTGIGRDGALDGAPPALVAAAFEAKAAGDAQIVTAGTFIALMRLDAIIPASDNPKAAELREAMAQQMGQSISADIFDLYGSQIETSAGIALDPAVISAVQTQLGN